MGITLDDDWNNIPADPKKESKQEPNLELTPDEEEELKRKLEELRKRDPFIYR